ncbi:MAG: hypothetical protein MJ189_02430 [Coriobacteriales bacterium]|nr:hypothetical protein [Coriobacteriales bacterium]
MTIFTSLGLPSFILASMSFLLDAQEGCIEIFGFQVPIIAVVIVVIVVIAVLVGFFLKGFIQEMKKK